MPVAVKSPRTGFLKLAKEATRGTPVAATVNMPVDSRTLQGRFARGTPNYMNNSIFIMREVFKGRQSASGDISGPVTTLEIGNVLMALFGQDTVTGVGPYVHTFAPAVTTPTYSIEKNRGLTGASASEQFANAICMRATFSGRVEQDDAPLAYASSWLAKAPTLITPTAWTAPTGVVIPAPLLVWTYGAGSVVDRLAEWSITFEREADFVKGANNSLDISDAVAVAFRVSGYFDVYFIDLTEYNDFVANTQKILRFKTALSANESIEFFVPRAHIMDENANEGGIFQRTRFPFVGVYDVAGAAQAILTNGQTLAY